MKPGKKTKEPKTSPQELADEIVNAESIMFVTGAGISVSAGIPDFRSPGTGLYYTLEKYQLPIPMAIFDIDYFRKRPKPFFSLEKDLFPSKNYSPTFAHAFIAYIEREGKMSLNITQNIDGLEDRAKISKVCLAHGSFSLPACCCSCKREYSTLTVKAAAFDDAIPICACGSVIKPQIVFFGEPVILDEKEISEACKGGLCIVMGTSLNVGPVNGIPLEFTGKKALINKEKAGDYISWDHELLGDCDTVLLEVCKCMGCVDEVEEILSEMRESVNSINDCFLEQEPSDLSLICVTGELIIPTSVQVIIDGTRVMFALSSPTQIDRLVECGMEVFDIEISLSRLPSTFKPFLRDGRIKCFAKGDQNNAVYKPIDGHFSSYVYEFEEYFIDYNGENDIWDVISRFADTKVNDKIVLRNRDGENGNLLVDVIERIKLETDQVETSGLDCILQSRMRKVTTVVAKNSAFAPVTEVKIAMNVTLKEDQTMESLIDRNCTLENHFAEQFSKILKTNPISFECTIRDHQLLFSLVLCQADMSRYDHRGILKSIETVLKKAFPEADNLQLLK